MPVTVAIVDDDPWVRYGRATALAREGGMEVLELTPRAARELGKRWAAVDVALVDAHDRTEAFDRFPGVGVVEAARADGRASTRVVVVSGHVANMFLRLRMAEAGADYLYHHEEVADPPSLLGAVTSPSPSHAVTWPDQCELALFGLGPSTRPNAALHYLEREGLLQAFDGQRSQKALAISRRTIMRVRREVGHLAGLSSTAASARDLQAPEWRTVVDFVNRARGLERRSPPMPGGGR